MTRAATVCLLCLIACSGEQLGAGDAELGRPLTICAHPDDPEPEPSDQVDKGATVVSLHGFAMRSKLTPRCFNSAGDPIFPCIWGYEPCTVNAQGLCQTDTFISGLSEWDKNLFGRCGSEGPITEFRACIRPHGRATAADRTWYYRINLNDCPNDSARRTAMVNGIREGFENIDRNSGHTFTETILTSLPHTITVRCAVGSEVTALSADGALATGMPSGQLQFSFGAPNSVYEGCDESGYGTLGDSYLFATDRFFTYGSGAILMNWDTLWSELTSCGERTQTGFYDRAIQFITMHELGHVMGFGHHQWSSVDERNVMYSAAAFCGWLNIPPAGGWLPQLEETLDLYDTTPGSNSASLVSTNLSCLTPD